jgi:hypothetical protein
MRQNSRRHPDRDAFGPEHQQQGQFARQHDRFFIAPVVAGDEIGDFVVE